MKILISESQYKKIQKSLEEDYPTTWNVEEFANLKTFKDRIQYCENNLIRLGSGSSRITYKIDDTKVLKLAKNKKGIAQNEVEVDHSNDYILDNIVAQIFHHDENFQWVEMELARKLTLSMFQKITGVSFENYTSAINYYHNDINARRGQRVYGKPDNFDELWDNEFVSGILDMIGNYSHLPIGDFLKLSSYGVVKREYGDWIVFIDYGLNDEVYEKHYKR